jgi:3-hydroxyacyl-[acyl-carrier-protein] dehydratase
VMHAIAIDTGLTETAWQINSVKFLSPLKPAETVIIEYEQLANGTLKFEVLEGNRQIVIGSLITKQRTSIT